MNFCDRNVVPRLTRMKGNIPYKKGEIRVFPDFLVEVQKKRALINEDKRQLRVRHYSYAMLFLARLRVVGDDKTHFFDAPEAVFAWLENRAAPALDLA